MRLHCVKGKKVTVSWGYAYDNDCAVEKWSVVETAAFFRPGYHCLVGNSDADLRQQEGGVWHRQTFYSRDVSRFHVNIRVMGDHEKLPPWNRITARDTVEGACRDFYNMLQNSDTADVQVVCGDTTFPCHKSFLAARSSVFKAMFYGSGNFVESNDGKVTIMDFKPEEIKEFLTFVYSGECNFEDVEPWQMLALADKYDVKMLNNMSCEVICTIINVSVYNWVHFC